MEIGRRGADIELVGGVELQAAQLAFEAVQKSFVGFSPTERRVAETACRAVVQLRRDETLPLPERSMHFDQQEARLAIAGARRISSNIRYIRMRRWMPPQLLDATHTLASED